MLKKTFLNLTLALGALLGTALLIKGALAWAFPAPKVYGHGLYERFAAVKERTTTLFMGSSSVGNGVIPALFDQAVAGPSVSFNYSPHHLTLADMHDLLGELQARGHGGVRDLVLELPSTPHFERWREKSVEMQQRYSAERSWRYYRWFLRHARHDPWTHLKNAATLGRAGMTDWLNLGRAQHPKRARQELDAWDPAILEALARERGYFPLRGSIPGFDAAAYQRKLSACSTEAHDDGALQGLEQEALPVIDRARSMGLRVTLLVTPKVGPCERAIEAYLAAYFRAQGIPVLDFSDPAKHSELFRLEHRFDDLHLNHEGAQRLTQALARAWR